MLRSEHSVDVVIALTHMRLPEDVRLCKESKGIDIVLGGHDHFEHSSIETNAEGSKVYLAKAGMDFRFLTKLTVKLEFLLLSLYIYLIYILDLNLK